MIPRHPAALALAALALAACAPRTAPRPAPPVAPPQSPTPSRAQPAATSAAAPGAACCLAQGLSVAERHRAPEITERRFSPETMWAAMAPALSSPALEVQEVGRSMQGRPIRSLTFGTGPTRVLLWSQMHGNEPTATMALADIVRWMAATDPDPLRDRLRGALTITMIPMLNPDGAALFQRQNAMGIDVNRDARALVTAEARTLKAVHDRVRPHFGFNLHDQNARQLVGKDGLPAGIALLAPAHGPNAGYNEVRGRARLVASTIATMLEGEIPGRTAKYDDEFNPRAFGDLIQQWGTSTVLVESGALPGDPEKQRLRAVNVAILLTALDAIATGRYAQADPAVYDRLPYNTGVRYDVMVRGASLVVPGLAPVKVDLAFTYDDAVAKTGLRLRDVGDLDGLRGVAALDTIDAAGLFAHPAPSTVTEKGDRRWLELDSPARLVLRRGVQPTSAQVRVVGDAR